MLIAQIMTGPQTVVFGLSILFVAVLMRRSANRSKRSRNRDPVAEVRGEIHQREKEGASKIEQLKLDLYEHSREVEARIETRIELLDQLVAAADVESVRLESLLKLYLEQADSADNKLVTPHERRMIEHLSGAGYSPEAIADLSDRPEPEIRDILGDRAA